MIVAYKKITEKPREFRTCDREMSGLHASAPAAIPSPRPSLLGGHGNCPIPALPRSLSGAGQNRKNKDMYQPMEKAFKFPSPFVDSAKSALRGLWMAPNICELGAPLIFLRWCGNPNVSSVFNMKQQPIAKSRTTTSQTQQRMMYIRDNPRGFFRISIACECQLRWLQIQRF